MTVKNTKPSLKGQMVVPGDKSISHRALIFTCLSRGLNRIVGCSPAQDLASTASCLCKLGLTVIQEPIVHNDAQKVRLVTLVNSGGLNSLKEPDEVLNAGNSGTTMRLLAGLVAGRNFLCHFDGDNSLRNRPMSRILDPLTKMGALIEYKDEISHSIPDPIRKGFAPFSVQGGNLKGKDFKLPVASAQVQTSLLLAGLQAVGTTSVATPATVRDHTTRMFSYIGVPFSKSNGVITVNRLEYDLSPYEIEVPGDLSSAAFFLVASACLPGSELLLKHVGINPGRRLILDVLTRMGADLSIDNEREYRGEPVADIQIKYSGRLQSTSISNIEIASGIDEIPILALAGALSEGSFSVRGAQELRHKESDRLKAIVINLRQAGVTIEELPDGFEIKGQAAIPGGSFWQTHKDHRLAMSGLIAKLLFEKEVEMEETGSIQISYPGFEHDLNKVLNG